jgi:hypothetical protein
MSRSRSFAVSAVVGGRREEVVPPDQVTTQKGVLAQPAAGWPGWIQRCGVGSSCGCNSRGKVSAIDRDLQRATSGGGAALSDTTRMRMEAAFSADFSGVRVHTGPAAHEFASTLHAQALTAGSDIVFRAGYRRGTPAGDRLMAHELAHVVQQNHGLPMAALDGGPADPLEQAADRAAEAASQPAEGAARGADARGRGEPVGVRPVGGGGSFGQGRVRSVGWRRRLRPRDQHPAPETTSGDAAAASATLARAMGDSSNHAGSTALAGAIRGARTRRGWPA